MLRSKIPIKRKILAIGLSAILVSSTFIGLSLGLNNPLSHNATPAATNPDLIISNVLETTSSIPKSLIIGQNHKFTTNLVFNDMENQIQKQSVYHINNPNNVGASGFIKEVTKNLDYQSTAMIEANFVDKGANQEQVTEINNKIHRFSQLKQKVNPEFINQYFNNQFLQNNLIQIALNNWVTKASENTPIVSKVLDNIQYLNVLKTILQQLTTDWDQQLSWGNTPQLAIENYMANANTDGRLSQAKVNNQWNVIQKRDSKWTWNDFYQYIAGVNFNYMFKVLTAGIPDFPPSGQYLGEIITNNITTQGVGPRFDDQKFNAQISKAFGQLPVNPSAWPYLIKAIVPIFKFSKDILNLSKPTKKIEYLDWNNSNNSTTVALQTILNKVLQLVTVDKSTGTSKALVSLFTSLITSNTKFAEDVILKVPIINITTLPELFDNFIVKYLVKPQSIAMSIAKNITNKSETQKIQQVLKIANNFLNTNLITNPVFDLNQINDTLNAIFNTDFFNACDKLNTAIKNKKIDFPTCKAILAQLGVNYASATSEFRQNSPLFGLQKSINGGIFKQLFVVASTGQDSIIATIIKNQQVALNNLYFQYFDLDNQNKFKIIDPKLTKQYFNGKLSYSLTYILFDQLRQQRYHLAFISPNLVNPHFYMSCFQKV